MARLLQAARAETAATLRAQVDKVTAEPAHARAGERLVGRRELRGWPVAGRGITGAINDTIPGASLGLLDE